MLLLVACLAHATPSATELAAAWEAHRPALSELAVHPLAFTTSEWERVAKGKVAKRRERLEGADRVVGLIWVDGSQEAAWVSVQDPHGSYIDGMVNEDLPQSTFQHRLLYQSIDLPWPLASRQWVIDVRNNLPLLSRTDGAVWERSWVLSPERGAKAELDNGVWLPVNDGGWYFVSACGGTLLAYHARTVVGGNVPDDLATRWSFGTLTGMLTGVRDRLPWVATHYIAGHQLLQRPDGKIVEAPLP